MTPMEIAEKMNFEVMNKGDGDRRTISGIYCCDLLSIVMGHAPADSVWITVMANINSLAVAALADVSCLLIAENIRPDESVIKKAAEQNICLLATEQPIFPAAMGIAGLIRQ